MSIPIAHRFVDCGGRHVMMRCAGSGPPVVLLHESPRSSAAFIPMIEAFADRFTVIAPDTPGFGGSDPLALHRPQIADYAAALAETIDALGLERTTIFGRHTGAAIAIEYANRYPARTTGVVLEGCPAFTPHEMEELVANYLPPFRPVWDGGHVTWLWARVRDQITFFPWYRQGAASRLAMDMPRPSILNRIATDFLLAGDGYRAAYEAAFRYDGAAAAASAQVPAHYVATETDVLLPHLDRLPGLPTNAQIHRLTDAGRVSAIGEMLAAMAAGDASTPPRESGARRFVQLDADSVLVRQWGPNEARPLLLVPDLPGSSRQAAPLATRLKDRRVVAIDPPGHGLSSAAAAGHGDGGAKAVADALAALGIDALDIAGINLGAWLAVRIAAAVGSGVGRLLLIDPPPDPPSLAEHHAVDLSPRWDGAHLGTAWQMLREALLYRPWFTPSRAHQIPVEIGFDVEALHERFVDTILSGAAFADTCRAVCGDPSRAVAAAAPAAMTVVITEGYPDAADQAALAARLGASVVHANIGVHGQARAILAALETR